MAKRRKVFIGIVTVGVLFFGVFSVIVNPQWIQPIVYLPDPSTAVDISNVSFPPTSRSSQSRSTSLLYKSDFSNYQETVYHRKDKTPEETEQLSFLKNFKNPCWREATVGNSSAIRCLPYFYLVGPPKCGTTDLHRRLTRHPKISSTVKKEIQWIAKTRFRNKSKAKLSGYLHYFEKAISTDIIPSGHDGYHDAILGDFSPSTIWCTVHYWKAPSQKFTSNAEVIHHLNPGAKILITLRNPVTRAYSDFKHFERRASPTLFHSRVVQMIQDFHRRCKNTTNMKRCIDLFANRMLIGAYSEHLEDYLKVFPREQIYVTKLEERSKNMDSALDKICSFLEIDHLPNEIRESVVTQHVQAKDTHGVPEMFNKTKILLEEFFKPFNEKLGDLIGQEFNYNIHK